MLLPIPTPCDQLLQSWLLRFMNLLILLFITLLLLYNLKKKSLITHTPLNVRDYKQNYENDVC